MTMRKPTARYDANHKALTSDFMALGCTVLDAHASGIPGQPDVIVGCVGVNHLVEYKNPTTRYGQAGLSPSQSTFQRHWNGGPVFVATCTDDCVDLVNLWRRYAARKMT